MVSRAFSVRMALVLASVYLSWGSTYLAIRFAIDTLPPFTMAGGRFLIAGLCLFLFARGSRGPMPTRVEWRSTALIGSLMLVGGNGAVCWAERQGPQRLCRHRRRPCLHRWRPYHHQPPTQVNVERRRLSAMA